MNTDGMLNTVDKVRKLAETLKVEWLDLTPEQKSAWIDFARCLPDTPTDYVVVLPNRQVRPLAATNWVDALSEGAIYGPDASVMTHQAAVRYGWVANPQEREQSIRKEYNIPDVSGI